MFKLPRAIAPILCFSVLLASCSKDDKKSTKISLKVKNAGATAATLTPRAVSLTAGAAGNLSFTPESYKLWISTIVLQNDAGLSNQFYTCDTSAEDCEVDFGDPASISAFEAKLSALPVGAGSYTKVWLSCNPSTGGYVKFKGHATLANGVVYYTANQDDNGGDPLTTDASKAGTLKIANQGCGLTMPLARTLVVESSEPSDTKSENVPTGTTLTMTMFSNLLLVGMYSPNVSAGAGGCALNRDTMVQNSGPGFCAAYPSVFPYFGETTPTVEFYKVSHSKTSSTGLTIDEANVIVKIIKDGAGTPFWASFNSIAEESTLSYGDGDKGVSGYANSVTTFAVNADSSLVIKSMDYGFSAFARSNHSGEVIGEGILNGAGTGSGVTYYYSAFPYTP